MSADLKTPGEILDRISIQKPDEIVITTIMRDGSDDAITRQALKHRSDSMGQALQDAGVSPGDFVPIHLPTCTDFLVATIAVFKAGGTPMPESAHSTRSMVFSPFPVASEFLKSGDEVRRVTVVILRSMPPEAVYLHAFVRKFMRISQSHSPSLTT